MRRSKGRPGRGAQGGDEDGFYVVDSPSGGKIVPSRLRWAVEKDRARRKEP